MELIDIVKNPVIIGLIAGVFTYIYMKWKYNKKDKKNKKNKNNKNNKKKDVNLLIPLAIFILFWFISYAYFSSSDAEKSYDIDKIQNAKDIKIEVAKTKLDSHSSNDEPLSFKLVSNGVYIPSQLPEIMFEMY